MIIFDKTYACWLIRRWRNLINHFFFFFNSNFNRQNLWPFVYAAVCFSRVPWWVLSHCYYNNLIIIIIILSQPCFAWWFCLSAFSAIVLGKFLLSQKKVPTQANPSHVVVNVRFQANPSHVVVNVRFHNLSLTIYVSTYNDQITKIESELRSHIYLSIYYFRFEIWVKSK